MTFLSTIIEAKRAQIEALEDLQTLKIKADEYSAREIRNPRWVDELSVIAEIKRKSPSKGDLAAIEDPASLAQIYERSGASVISVLTDEKFFGAKSDDLSIVRNAVSVPVLRKDFIIDERQVFETFLMDADLMLLIVAAFEDLGLLSSLYQTATSLGLNVLVETHSIVELEIANDLGAQIIGVNVRDLSSFDEKPELGDEMISLIDKSAISVWESSISSIEDAARAKRAGAKAVLVGQALVQHNNPGGFIEQIRGIV